MIQRCPQCGNWVKAEEKQILDRYIAPALDAAKTKNGLFERTSERLGFGKIGRIADQVIEAPKAVIKGVGEAVFGDRFNFECPNC